MPGGDGTGPMGIGPRTGRAAGYCAGYSVPGFMNPLPRFGMGRGFGRGMGRGFGRGFGLRRFGFAPVAPIAPLAPVAPVTPIEPAYQYQPTKEQELQMLQQEAKALEEEQKLIKEDMEAIKKRIEELRKSK